ncbi:MAG: PA2169 family four-helix-bundle protein [Phycisphaerales bacterium]|nr:PA2169 family four-helix-bundle protein [Phycisphaerales bacterium]
MNVDDTSGTDRCIRGDNRDPITGAPGAHPVGAGAGAVAGAAAGGAIGAVGGPAGIVAGAVIGGVAGGLVGKGAAEAVNPTAELEYWRTVYEHRPYAAGWRYEDFEPAYLGAIETCRVDCRPDLTWEELEPRLRADWPRRRGDSALEWRDARHASKDAWERIAARSKGRVAEAEGDAAEKVNGLIEVLHDGAKGFRSAAERVQDPTFRSKFQEFARQREQFIAELKPMVAARGENPERHGSFSGASHRAWLGLRTALGAGDRAIVNECERGEDAAVTAYKDALDGTTITPEFRSVLSRQYQAVKATHDRVSAWKHSMK